MQVESRCQLRGHPERAREEGGLTRSARDEDEVGRHGRCVCLCRVRVKRKSAQRRVEERERERGRAGVRESMTTLVARPSAARRTLLHSAQLHPRTLSTELRTVGLARASLLE